MSRQILTELSTDKELMEVCKKITSNSDLWKDLFQDTILTLFQKPPEVIQESFNNGKIKAFFIKTMLNLWSDERRLQERISTTEFTSSTPVPRFSEPTITTDISYWQGVIEQNNYHITSINPESVKIVKVLEQMRYEDNNRPGGTGCPYRTIIFNWYLQMGSGRAVARHCNINFMTISRTIKEVKQLIRQAK